MKPDNNQPQLANQNEEEKIQSQDNSSTKTEMSSMEERIQTHTGQSKEATTISMDTPTKFQLTDRVTELESQVNFLLNHLNRVQKYKVLWVNNKIELEKQVDRLVEKYWMLPSNKKDWAEWIKKGMSPEDMEVIDKYLSNK